MRCGSADGYGSRGCPYQLVAALCEKRASREQRELPLVRHCGTCKLKEVHNDASGEIPQYVWLWPVSWVLAGGGGIGGIRNCESESSIGLVNIHSFRLWPWLTSDI